jgi:putative Mn2+ efflux pump MntP
LNIIGIAVGLAMDALAVAVATGMSLPKVTHRHVFRQAFHFGLFQFLMPVLGWLAGKTIAARAGAWDNWIAFALLIFVGGKMLWEARHAKGIHRADPTRGWRLITLSVATSIDALAVGLSTGFLHVSIWAPSVVIGVVAGILTAVGILFGGRVGPRFGRVADLAGGLILIVIGLKLLVSSL